MPRTLCAGPLVSIPGPTICEFSLLVRSQISPEPARSTSPSSARMTSDPELAGLIMISPLLVAEGPVRCSVRPDPMLSTASGLVRCSSAIVAETFRSTV